MTTTKEKKKKEKTQNKERFISILNNTGRDGVKYVIEELESLGFFEAPASSSHHLNEPGGLLKHSLNVYDEAMMLGSILSQHAPKSAHIYLRTALQSPASFMMYAKQRYTNEA